MRKVTYGIVLAVLALAVMFGVMFSGGGVTAAPLAAPTPVSVTQPVRTQPQLYTLMNAALTADTRGSCWELGVFSVADIQYTIDQSTTNTVTLKLQYTNDQTTYTDGLSVVTDNAADASGMNQYPLFGRFTCLYADVTNTNTVTTTVTAWVK